MDFPGRHVVVTGGTGALGEAVVGTLLAAGASCHVPYRKEQEADRFAHRNHHRLSLVPLGDLTDERAVTAFYEDLSPLWASIHIAGGFASAPIARSDKALLLGQLESNLISAYLCSRAAVAAFRRGPGPGRIVNVAASQALDPRLGASLTSMPEADFDAWPKVEEVAATIAFPASPQKRVLGVELLDGLHMSVGFHSCHESVESFCARHESSPVVISVARLHRPRSAAHRRAGGRILVWRGCIYAGALDVRPLRHRCRRPAGRRPSPPQGLARPRSKTLNRPANAWAVFLHFAAATSPVLRITAQRPRRPPGADRDTFVRQFSVIRLTARLPGKHDRRTLAPFGEP